MPRNVYFSQAVKSEQNLYEDLIIESLKIFGQDVYYIPRTLVTRDNVLGEDSASKFDDAYLLEAYIENQDGFEGSGDLYSKFGVEIRDEATFIISRSQWNKFVGLWNNQVDTPKPLEGDIIFLPMTNKFFEITFIEHEQPFYQLSNLPVYRLQCALFEYNDEDFETGVELIDDLSQASAYTESFDVTVTSGNHFKQGEIVSQTLVAASGSTPAVIVSGEVATITKTSDLLATISLSNINVTGSSGEARAFIVSNTLGLVGAESTNTCFINKIYGLTDTINTFATDGGAENVAFEIAADGFLDFTETNPFGDPSETY
tara:strand:+ start:3157 stop:4104 length:948 start_codon:yes stop_codon:yes gene_type:complete